MLSRFLPRALSLIVLLSLLPMVQRCGPQTSGEGKQTVHNKDSGSVGDSGGEVGIDDGSKVSVPAGALAVGSEVTVQKVGQPSDFNVTGVSAASSPVEISATGPDGQTVDQASQPMTVNLVVGTASLRLLAEAKADNLCVLLKAKKGGLFVWRRTSVTYDEAAKTASVQTLYFGIFQLVYCGTDALAGFADASVQGITGETKISVSMSIPQGFDSDLGIGSMCMGVFRDKDDDNDNGNDSGPYTASVSEAVAASSAGATLTADVGASQIVDGQDHYVLVVLQGEGATCPFKAGEIAADDLTAAGVKSMYGFKIPAATLKAGISGELGAEGVYKLTTADVKLGGPGDFAAFAMHDEATVCLSADLDDGIAKRLVSFSAGAISGSKAYKMPIPVGLSTDSKTVVEARIGENCDHFDDVGDADPTSGKPYQVRLTEGDPLYLTPVTLKVHSSNALFTGANVCLDINFPGSASLTGGTDNNKPLGQFTIALGDGEYPVFLPFITTGAQTDGTPLYDMNVTVLGTGGTCDDKKNTVPSVPLSGRPLTEVIDLSI